MLTKLDEDLHSDMSLGQGREGPLNGYTSVVPEYELAIRSTPTCLSRPADDANATPFHQTEMLLLGQSDRKLLSRIRMGLLHAEIALDLRMPL